MSSNIIRKKGQSGRARSVECTQCGALIPCDRAKAKRRYVLPLNRRLIKMLKDQGARIHAGMNPVS